jgi:hypothetical protein
MNTDSDAITSDDNSSPTSVDVPSAAGYFNAEITALGLQSLQVYQRQHEIADRLWSYFNQYSGLLVMLGLLAVVFRETTAISGMPRGFIFLPPAAYAFFFFGNHSALRLTVDELAQLREVAISKTRLRLKTGKSGTVLLFHLLIAYITLVIYAVAWYHVLA